MSLREEGEWVNVCRRAALARGAPPDVLRKLHAFGPRAAPADAGRAAPAVGCGPESFAAWTRAPYASFASLAAAAAASAGAVREAMIERLLPAVPAARAVDQARRLDALLRGLSGIGSFEAQLLQIGLLARLAEALCRPERRASRVRDILDFHYGHASVMLHGGEGLPAPGELAAAAPRRSLGPGLSFAAVEAPSALGPARLHVLRARGVPVRALHVGPSGAGLESLVASSSALAGISGGYVLCSDMDLEPPSRHADPVGLVVQDGEVVSPPVFPRACLLDGPEGPDIRVVGPVGLRVRCASAEWVIGSLDDPAGLGSGPAAFNRVWGPVSPAHGGVSVALLGRRILAVGSGPLPIPKAGMVLALPPGAAVPAQVVEGAEVEYELSFELHSAMAGGPMLLSEDGADIDLAREHFVPAVPPYTFAADETLDQNLLPRMVAGLTAEGELVIVAVDGRNFRRGVGMTLRQCRDLLRALGCSRGMNLDGGDSKRMVVEGRVVDLPGSQLEWDTGAPGQPDASRLAEVRPVYSAILLGAGSTGTTGAVSPTSAGGG